MAIVERFSLVLDATSSVAAPKMSFGLGATEISPAKLPVSRAVPPFIDQGQAYYWSYKWQLGEAESRDELAAGQGKAFANAEDAIRWLLADDE